MNNLKNEKGITLISLVITIVVLAIIATITISISTDDTGLINETITSTEDIQINRYKEIIEITRQEALSREYILQINNKTVLEEIRDIMNNDYADKAYKVAKENKGVPFEITGTGENAYIVFETVEGYVFNIYEDRTKDRTEENKYIKLIEMTRQEATELIIDGKTVLEKIRDIMNSNNADKLYKVAKENKGEDFSITEEGDEPYILFETAEGYVFRIYENWTEDITE